VSIADRDAPWLAGRETVCLGGARSSDSYLDMQRVVQAARQTECSALHPGWGFLAENAVFAALCEQHGISFVGPPARAMVLMGTKTPAKHAMAKAGLRVIEGSHGVLADVAEAKAVAERVGYPVLLKAESGGGGRGMRVARDASEIEQAYAEAEGEARAAFGDARLYLERLIEGGRHIEIQLLGDKYGDVIHLGERDCSVQRKHQKLIEESPAPRLDAGERKRTLAAAVRASAQIGYVGAGTMEFLLDHDGKLRFMEMNTRLQVEHGVSEMTTGIDLVVEQLRVAAGHRVRPQEDVGFDGHVIECRINAEDPSDGFRPTPGTITRWRVPDDEQDVRVDTHVSEGYTVPPHYDSLLCKVLVRGADRDAACDRMIAALERLSCEGVATTTPLHLAIMKSDAFRRGDYDTRAIPGWSD
jgi:acetyl-CoA carboxylase biotin carboxylase subunit